MLLRSAKEGAEDTLSTGFFGYDPVPAVRSDESDVVQLHWIGAMTMALGRLRCMGKPIVWRLPDMWAFTGVEHYTGDDRRFRDGYSESNRPRGESGFDISRFAWMFKKRVYGRIKSLTLVSPSEWLAGCVRESALLGGREVVVIKTGCDTQLFRPLDRTTCRELLGLPQDRRLILVTAAHLRHPRKGVDLFFDAIRFLRESLDNTSFSVVLLGADQGELGAGMGVPVHSMGFVEDALHRCLIYNAADLVVAPSRQENLANTVLEALSCGTPCAAFRVGGMPDAIEHRSNGWLAEPFSIENLAEGMQWVLDHAKPEDLRHAARRKVEGEFTIEMQAKQFLELYKRLC